MPPQVSKELPVPSGNARVVAQSSSLLRVLPPILRILKREPALGITLAYLLVALAGIFYNFRFYERFSIPVLTLSQISDFLVAGIQEPMAILLVLSTLPLCWVFDFINLTSRRRAAVKLQRLVDGGQVSWLTRLRLRYSTWSVRDKWLLPLLFPFIVVMYGWLFVRSYADYRASEIIAGKGEQVTVWLTGDANPLQPVAKTWTYLGATSTYVFVYDAATKRSAVLPVNNITRLVPAETAQTSPQGTLVVPIP